MGKLNQVLAVEKGIKVRTYSELTALDKKLQKPALLTGISRVYAPLADDAAEALPAEATLVQLRVTDALEQIVKLSVEAWDITATKEWSNMGATADIVVDGTTLLGGVPVTFLLFLEKQLTDVRTMIGRLPVLDPAYTWTQDQVSNSWKTPVVQTHRTKKEANVVVKYAATAEHPAQTELFFEDRIVGFWNTTHFSGSLPAADRDAMMERVDALLNAVKTAREAANSIEAPNQTVAGALLGYVFQG